MKRTYKRILSVLLALAMLAAFLPAGVISAAEPLTAEKMELTQDDYAQVDAVFAEIEAMEDLPAKKNSSQTALTDGAVAIVIASDSYVEGSLVRNGDSFTWETDTGIRCIYSPRLRKINAEMEAPSGAMADGIYNEPTATKGGWPAGNQVYLVGPYYGHDSNFSNQYKNEAKAIANAIGDTDGYTLYSGTAATVGKVAEAVSKGAVVIFDSHGMTDYENGYDYVTGAKSSYLCLTSTTGLTDEDYDDGALYYSDGICINGATIANHMTTNSPNGLLWMAICLGMATDTMCKPLREKGVEVVYGYSQSISFGGDYLYEETFWDEMCAGSTVAAATAAMKSEWGNWDCNPKISSYCGYSEVYSSIEAARKNYIAFPVVVSDEDAFPGQRNRNTFYGADSLQTVQSTYTLFTQYDVGLRVNNSAWGSASISGNTITVSPAQGYFAQGYTVISGNATVSQNGNTFVVNAQSDCVIQINFAAKTSVTVNFSGASVAPQTGYAGDGMALPVAAAPEGYTFLGWMDSPLSENTTEKPTYYENTFVPNGNTTLYALYSFVEENSGTGTGDYVKVTSTPGDWSGEYLIVYEDGGKILDSSLSTMDAKNNYKSVTITNGTISAEEGDPYKFIIAQYNGGYSIQGVNGLYIGCSSNANLLNTSTAALKNSLSLDTSDNANIIGSGGAYLRYNTSDNRFRYYKSSTYTGQKAVALYVKDGTAGTTWYTGTTVVCQHSETQTVAAVAPGCTQGGFTEGLYCVDCETYISGREPVDALGHSYSAQVFAPTVTQQGYTVYTCIRCGESYTGDYVEALGETYTVSFEVPSGVEAITDMPCDKYGITLPAAGVPAGEYPYLFLGWTNGRVDNATQRPEIYTGSFTAKENTTLYAVYSYVVDGTGAAEYVLKDLTSIKPTDKVVITVEYNGTVYAMNSSNGTSDGPDGIVISVITENGAKKLAAEPDASLLWNIGGAEGAYIIYPNGASDSWLYCKSTNNGVRVGGESAGTFSVVDDYLYNHETGRYLGVYRTNPDWRCYTSIHENIANQTLGFYVLGQAGTTYYTTEFAQPCAHESVTYSFVNNTHTFTCDVCGEVAFTKDGSDGKKFAINSAAPILSDDIVLKYRCTIPAGFTDAYIVFEFNGETYYTHEYEVENDGRYSFKFPYVLPQKMADNICATLYATVDGVEVSVQVAQYSMLQYCFNTLKKTNASEIDRTLYSDVLAYGAAVQVAMNYKTDALVTDLAAAMLAKLDNDQLVMTPSTFPGLDDSYNLQARYGDATFTGAVPTSATIVLGAKVKLRISITCTDLEAYSYKLTLNGREYNYTGADLVPVNDGSDGKYYLYFEGIKAMELCEVLTMTIWEGDTQVGYTLEYSVGTYIYKNVDKANTTEANRNLMKALFNYGESTKAAYYA